MLTWGVSEGYEAMNGKTTAMYAIIKKRGGAGVGGEGC